MIDLLDFFAKGFPCLGLQLTKWITPFFSHTTQLPHKISFVFPKNILQEINLFNALFTPLADTYMFSYN